MEEVSLTETESRYFSDLFICCDVEKTGKVPMSKADELFGTANLPIDVIREITSLSGIPETALHISRSQFYSCLKLIAASQANISLRAELIASSINLPLPRFNWTTTESPTPLQSSRKNSATSSSTIVSAISTSSGGTLVDANGIGSRSVSRDSTLRRSGDWRLGAGEPKSPDLIQLAAQLDSVISDIQSTDSEVEQNESSGGDHSGRKNRRGAGSPEAWSTNSDSPTPTNSVAERPWANESLWHGLLGDEHRQLLGTEEESSDRHSSDEDNESELDAIYQINPEQRDYYHKQFKALQPDTKRLLSGHLARVFFEKSRIPVEELRHIWQLCDVTRDGALSLEEFTAAMHLVVLRRYNIPLPLVLPPCLHPTAQAHINIGEPPEADLLHLNDDSDAEKTLTEGGGDFKRPRPEKNVMNLSILSGSSQTNSSTISPPPIPPPVKRRSVSNSPPTKVDGTSNSPSAVAKGKDVPKENNQSREWTKFPESPTSNLSSPGPKPVNFDMKITNQAIVSDPQILHPVPLRVTPVGAETNSTNCVEDDNNKINRKLDTKESDQQPVLASRDSIPNNDLRAIQRPQAKKLPVKTVGAIPPPPQREPSITGSTGDSNENIGQKDLPPLPPPRPHRHTRSSSLDLNKLKLTTSVGVGGRSNVQNEITTQVSFDVPSESTGFADFTQFSGSTAEKMPKTPAENDVQFSIPPRPTVTSIQSNQRVSAFEVYRKPVITPRNSQSPELLQNTTQVNSSSGVEYDKRVSAISETLRNVSFRQNKNISEILKHLKEQNGLLLRLCHDLSEELLSVQNMKEEIRAKLESSKNPSIATVGVTLVTSNTGGSGESSNSGGGVGGMMQSTV